MLRSPAGLNRRKVPQEIGGALPTTSFGFNGFKKRNFLSSRCRFFFFLRRKATLNELWSNRKCFAFRAECSRVPLSFGGILEDFAKLFACKPRLISNIENYSIVALREFFSLLAAMPIASCPKHKITQARVEMKRNETNEKSLLPNYNEKRL